MVRNASAAFSTTAPMLTLLFPGRFDGVGIDALLEDRGWFEYHDAPGRDRHFFAGLGISPNPLSLLAHHKGPEGRQLHGLTPLEAIGNFLEDQFNERCRF